MHLVSAGLAFTSLTLLCNATPHAAADHGVCDHFKCERDVADAAWNPTATTTITRYTHFAEPPYTRTSTIGVEERDVADAAWNPTTTMTLTRYTHFAESPYTRTSTLGDWDQKAARSAAAVDTPKGGSLSSLATGTQDVIPAGIASSLPSTLLPLQKSGGHRMARNPFSALRNLRPRSWWNPFSKKCNGRTCHQEPYPCPCSALEWSKHHEAYEYCSWEKPCKDNTMPCPCDKNEKASPRCDRDLPCLNQRFPCPCSVGPEYKEWGWWVDNKCDYMMPCEYYPDNCTRSNPENCKPLGYGVSDTPGWRA